MTTVNGYWLYVAPCCGERYRMPVYRSVCLNGKQVWSDGYWYGELWTPRRELNHCRCGEFFLTDESEKYGPYDDCEDENFPALLSEISDETIFSHVELGRSLGNPKQECELRRYYWQLLNHRQRSVGTYSKRGLPGDITQREELPAWCRLTQTETNERMQENLKALISLMGECHQNERAILGDMNRMIGSKSDAIKHYRMDAHLSDTSRLYLINQAMQDERRLVRIYPPDWLKEMPDSKRQISNLRSRTCAQYLWRWFV